MSQNPLEQFSAKLLGYENRSNTHQEPYESFYRELCRYESLYTTATPDEMLEMAVDNRIVVPAYIVKAAIEHLEVGYECNVDAALRLLRSWTSPPPSSTGT